MARRHPCDVCGHPRRRWQRLCEVCWGQLAPALRSAVIDSFRQNRRADWRAARKAALEHLGERVARRMAAFQARTAAQLGERAPFTIEAETRAANPTLSD